MKILIDGYNLIWAVPELRKKVLKKEQGINLEEGRKGLLHLLDLYQRGHPKLDITIVFDAKEEIFPYSPSQPGVRVLYSKGETADSLIKRTVEDEKKPQETLVVTSDKKLKGKVKEKGAQVIGSLSFFERISPRIKKRSGKEIDQSTIEEELKRTYKIE